MEQDEQVREQMSRLLPNRSRITLQAGEGHVGFVTVNVDPTEVRPLPPEVAAAMRRRSQQSEPRWVAMNQNHRQRPSRRARRCPPILAP